MDEESKDKALSQIRRYLDAGHSLSAIREAGWGPWLDYFESKGVQVDEAEGGSGRPKPYVEGGGNETGAHHANVTAETQALLHELDERQRAEFIAYTLDQRRPRLHRLFRTASRRALLAAGKTNRGLRFVSDSLRQDADDIKKGGYKSGELCRAAAERVLLFVPGTQEAASATVKEARAQEFLSEMAGNAEVMDFEFYRAAAAAGIAALVTAEDISVMGDSEFGDVLRASSNATRVVELAYLIDARASGKNSMALALVNAETAREIAQNEHVKWLRKRVRRAGPGHHKPSMLRRISSFLTFGATSVRPEARDSVRAYLAEEWKLAAFQDESAGRYNEVLTRYGGNATPGNPVIREYIVPAASRLRDVAVELVRRHQALDPVQDEAAKSYFSWQSTYLAYEEWVSAAVAAYEGLAEGEAPHLQRVEELFARQQQASEKAQQELSRLAGRLGMNAEEIRRLMQVAESAGAEEANRWL